MNRQKLILNLVFVSLGFMCFSQKQINTFDKNGKRHGLWTKNYHKTDQIRYKGKFNHGKEIDTFNFYTLSKGKSVLSAIKVFNQADSIADVTFFTSKKKVISKGKINSKRYVGKWVYYHKNSPTEMIIEHYNENGKLHGTREVFYKNGNLAEKAIYADGELNGESKWFSEISNTLLKHATYTNGKLNGKTINYNAQGNITSQGDYANNKKVGIWKYYKTGKISKEIDHTNQKVIKKYD